ncbi:PREDICTED: myelin-associated glycoprotein-like isoform X1 [Cyprinodon variegatus]|uniref:myelin-associated glycoprotein-like isoform X1 n=1 Tax=Cyprinodon variegatus TaxID=28743 RepID=UPI0007425009|nr:PREDICTED: myelin-associated glycoprotein-like isoform X1 [Cyprinodon variegatus]
MVHQREIIMCLVLTAVCSPVFGESWRASVTKNIDALVGSCVVLPCTFTHPGGGLSNSRLRGIWHRKDKWEEFFYHEDNTKILDSFKGRTKLMGRLGESNCTLEIIEVKDHDNGPFCFRVELVRKDNNQPTSEKFSFVEECAEIKMLHDPPKPKLGPLKTAIQGKPYTITCSIRHTCPSHPPKLTWTHGTVDDIIESHEDVYSGVWQTESVLSFIPEEKDDDSLLTCTATFNGNIRSNTDFRLNVKRTENYNHIIIPTVTAATTAVMFGLLCLFMTKKYKKRIQELQSQDGSMWNRMSRLSRRLRSGASGPTRSEQRRSIWSRFSRRPPRSGCDQSPNNAHSGGEKVSKPRFPSPKSQPKSSNHKKDFDDNDEYMNTADLNVYGNI